MAVQTDQSFSCDNKITNDDDDDDNNNRNTVIAWIETRTAPTCISKRLRALPVSDREGNKLYVITGIRKVWYGVRPASECVQIFGFVPPRYLCFMVSGILCDVVQFLIYIILYWMFKNPTLCWMLSFFGSVIARHTSHRYLVFGDYVGGYYRSLLKMYGGYSIIITLSTIFNFIMTKVLKFPHIMAWFVTLLWTGIANYFILKKIWSWGSNSNDRNHQLNMPR